MFFFFNEQNIKNKETFTHPLTSIHHKKKVYVFLTTGAYVAELTYFTTFDLKLNWAV